MNVLDRLFQNIYSEFMGRRRTFIESEAISSATAVFAERGFAGSSVDDLVRASITLPRSSVSAYHNKPVAALRRQWGVTVGHHGSGAFYVRRMIQHYPSGKPNPQLPPHPTTTTS